MTHRRITGIALSLALALTAIFATSAQASFHLMKVREVFLGSAGGNNAFIELQMTAAGQNLVAGQKVRFYTATGTLLGESPAFPANVGNADNQRTVLVGDTAVPGADVIYDMITETVATYGPGGGACFLGSNDCVSWGAFTGAASLPGPTGTPAAAIPVGSSINRSITPGCATLLEEGDDTNNSAADFTLGAPSPRGNATVPTEVECKPTTPVKKKCKKKKRKKKGGAKKSHEVSPAPAAKKKKRCGKKKKKKT